MIFDWNLILHLFQALVFLIWWWIALYFIGKRNHWLLLDTRFVWEETEGSWWRRGSGHKNRRLPGTSSIPWKVVRDLIMVLSFQNCFLNASCYKASDPFHPSLCDVPSKAHMWKTCNLSKSPILIIGDSRARMLFALIAMMYESYPKVLWQVPLICLMRYNMNTAMNPTILFQLQCLQQCSHCQLLWLRVRNPSILDEEAEPRGVPKLSPGWQERLA